MVILANKIQLHKKNKMKACQLAETKIQPKKGGQMRHQKITFKKDLESIDSGCC
jgi:hypothetical protein